MKERDKTIDILKGLCIILVILGHSGFPALNFIYLFHMPAFFITSGYCFSNRYTDDIHGIIMLLKSRIKSIYIPCAVYMAIFTLLHNCFIDSYIYLPDGTSVLYPFNYQFSSYYSSIDFVKNIFKSFLMLGHEPMSGVGWFFRVLFIVTMIYGIMQLVIKKCFKGNKSRNIANIIIALISMTIGYILSKKNITLISSIPSMFTSYGIFVSGYYLRMILRKYKELFTIKLNILILLGSFILLFVFDRYFSISIGDNYVPFPAILILISLVGWFFLYSISNICSLFIISHFLVYIGTCTATIAFLHFISFKLVTLIIIQLKDYPSYVLSSFPTALASWWPIYTVIGVFIPLIFKKITDIIMKQVKSIFIHRK